MDDFQGTQMEKSQLPRINYLIKYSQADLLKVPSREEFGKCIKTHFNKGSGKVKVQHWACSLEKHHKGGNHYHVALKLTGRKRWKSVKGSITSSEGIVVSFSDQHNNYYSAYRYICKEDTSVHQRKHHPNLGNISSPLTKKSINVTGTLGKPSPLTPLQLQNTLPKSRRAQKLNPSASAD